MELKMRKKSAEKKEEEEKNTQHIQNRIDILFVC